MSNHTPPACEISGQIYNFPFSLSIATWNGKKRVYILIIYACICGFTNQYPGWHLQKKCLFTCPFCQFRLKPGISILPRKDRYQDQISVVHITNLYFTCQPESGMDCSIASGLLRANLLESAAPN